MPDMPPRLPPSIAPSVGHATPTPVTPMSSLPMRLRFKRLRLDGVRPFAAVAWRQSLRTTVRAAILAVAIGVVVAGAILGVMEVMAQGYVNPMLGSFGQNFHEVLPYIIMVVFLMVRPYGIGGREEVERV